mmetsp:Transcript_27340/g.78665  ORF Transcript_27340/g.78665 Transcript_27340/m.78665 type:complete len:94 (-) Transcript_27340:1307-1588(-)
MTVSIYLLMCALMRGWGGVHCADTTTDSQFYALKILSALPQASWRTRVLKPSHMRSHMMKSLNRTPIYSHGSGLFCMALRVCQRITHLQLASC